MAHYEETEETKTKAHFHLFSTGTYLEEGLLAALADGIDSVGVEAAGGGDGGVVVDELAAVAGPVVVAVVVDVAVAGENQTVGTLLLRVGAVHALRRKKKRRCT